MMMHTPNTIGRPTSNAAVRNSDGRSVPQLARALEPPDKILDHDHRRIDEQSEVERAKAHEIGGHAEPLHRDERKE